jgi:hypothetical protein
MNLNKKILPLIERINFLTVQRYLQNRNWIKVQSKRENIAIFFRERPFPSEIIVPLDRGYSDYSELIFKAVANISKVENRDGEQIINDLLLPPSDVMRFRVDNKRKCKKIIIHNRL